MRSSRLYGKTVGGESNMRFCRRHKDREHTSPLRNGYTFEHISSFKFDDWCSSTMINWLIKHWNIETRDFTLFHGLTFTYYYFGHFLLAGSCVDYFLVYVWQSEKYIYCVCGCSRFEVSVFNCWHLSGSGAVNEISSGIGVLQNNLFLTFNKTKPVFLCSLIASQKVHQTMSDLVLCKKKKTWPSLSSQKKQNHGISLTAKGRRLYTAKGNEKHLQQPTFLSDSLFAVLNPVPIPLLMFQCSKLWRAILTFRTLRWYARQRTVRSEAYATEDWKWTDRLRML